MARAVRRRLEPPLARLLRMGSDSLHPPLHIPLQHQVSRRESALLVWRALSLG